MPSVAWNKRHWGSDYPWDDGGEEWSEPWGSSDAQWFAALYPRIHRHLPAPAILEIAPGHGRWTRFLLPQCDTFLGIDLNERCTTTCRQRFASAPHARFETNDGLSLDMAPDSAFDFIFCFDSLVHAEQKVMQSYIPQIVRKLRPGGAAFVHHSNLAAGHHVGPDDLGRSKSVSADSVAELVAASGGALLVQEIVTWGNATLLDCLTTFARKADHPAHVVRRFNNQRFMLEALFIKKFFDAYQW